MNETVAMVKKSLFSTRNIIIALVVLLVLTGGGLGYYMLGGPNSKAVAENELKDVVAKVGKLMVLPEGETPTLATVADPEKLKDQKFFTNAKTGDKVLIYATSQKAILYSPSLNKIVEVAPVNLGTGAP
ncbi:hypothetical protein K2P56_05215 [Patescibacteria group bacterium]|nr:hypothetical protein [Patescibacteria group bacterium]